MIRRFGAAPLMAAAFLLGGPVGAADLRIEPAEVPVWKAVYGLVEPHDTVAARSRIGGSVVELRVGEGDSVSAGETIATIRDDKLDYRIAGLDASIRALDAQLANARSDLARGETLVARGAVTQERYDQLKTQVDVYANQLASTRADRDVVVQQAAEGAVLAPVDGRVLSVPLTRGAVVLAGDTVATLGGGGYFLRLSLPERHAAAVSAGAAIAIDTAAGETVGRIARVYPEISGGRVAVDVTVAGLDTRFVGARVPVRVEVGRRPALMVPQAAVDHRQGLDILTVRTADGGAETRAVLLGERAAVGSGVEVVGGLNPGETVVLP